MKTFKIDEKTATAILNYLASKPYAETYQLIQSLQLLQEVTETKSEEKKK